ncbi:MAG: hypothetical protein V4619_07060 [Bacteroidota bacterium]
MKNVFLFISASILLLIGSCKKDNVEFSFVGRWDAIGRRNGDGMISEWRTEPTNSDKHVVFNADGTMSGTEFTEYDNYLVTDGNKLTFTKKNSTATQFYSFTINTFGTIELRPEGPYRCIEGCATRFIKRK